MDNLGLRLFRELPAGILHFGAQPVETDAAGPVHPQRFFADSSLFLGQVDPALPVGEEGAGSSAHPGQRDVLAKWKTLDKYGGDIGIDG